jgi:uncharacterized protein YacL
MDNKIIQCEKFESIGVGLGFLVPSAIFWIDFTLNHEQYMKSLEVDGIIAITGIILISIFLSWALIKFARTSYQKSKENLGDNALYIGGIITIMLVGVIVFFTGGMEHSLFRDYFIFIPAAIAIIFKAKKGLIIVLVACFATIMLIYYFEPNAYYGLGIKHIWPHASVYVSHFFAIYLLEQENNIEKGEEINV